MDEADMEETLETIEKHADGPPASTSLLQVDASVELEAAAQVDAQIQTTMRARSMATVQAKAAAEALAALGVEQKSQIKTADQNLIDQLKKTIS